MAAIAAEIHRSGADPSPEALNGLRRLYPKLIDSHRFLLVERDPESTGLACQLHPWETGMDNSPRWQLAVDAVVIDLPLPSYERLDTTLVSRQRIVRIKRTMTATST